MNKIWNIISDFFLGEKEVLTTDINDAFPYFTNIEDFPINPAPKEVIDRFNKEGILNLEPGVYDFNFKSFCLHAGKYGPYTGSGYLMAPLKGGKSETIKRILKNSANRSDIPQTDVQSLIWAVLANEKYGDFSKDMQLTADKLLEKNDLESLGKSFLDIIPEPIRAWLWGQVEKRLPEEVLSLWNRVNELKMKIRDARTTYEELESIAMRFGKPPIPENMLDIKEGTWSRIKEGCFARIFPDGYSSTRMQIYVPETSSGDMTNASSNKRLSRDSSNYSVIISGETAHGTVGIPANSNEQRLGFGGLFDSGDAGDGGDSSGGNDPDKKLKDKEARDLLEQNGITVNYEESRTSLEGVRQNTIDNIINFQEESGCDIVVTGGTESGGGHAAGDHSHANGYKLDIRSTDDVTNYIQDNFTPAGARSNGDPIYTDADGNEYCHEIHNPNKIHWDITYY